MEGEVGLSLVPTDLALRSRQFNVLMDFVERTKAAPSFDALFAQAAAFFESLGASGINCALFETASGNLVGFSSSMARSWIDHYVDEGFFAHDPLIDHYRQSSNSALFGWGSNDASIHQSVAGRRVFADCCEAGYPNLLFTPVKLEDQRLSASVTFGNNLGGPQSGQLLDEYGPLIVFCALCLGQRATEVYSEGAVGSSWNAGPQTLLSPREREVVQWMIAGLRTDKIAHKMNLASVTVQMHISSARRKLGAKTREQTVAMAIMRGIV